MPEIEMIRLFATQGAAVLCYGILIFALVKLAMYFGKPFIEAQRQQASAMLEQALSMKTQAECLGVMKDSVQEFVLRDNNDHREILLNMQVIIKEVAQLGAEVKTQGGIIKAIGAGAEQMKPDGMAAEAV
jgi:hypothetical protein